jgi:hypothetical protein
LRQESAIAFPLPHLTVVSAASHAAGAGLRWRGGISGRCAVARPITNADLAAAFSQVADLLELQKANPFRVRAYRNASRIVGELKLDLAAHLAAGNALPRLPGIGADLTAKIRKFATTGRLALLDRLRQDLPAGISELLDVPGLGPKRVRALYDELHVHSLPQLQRAARDGRVREVHGFGIKMEEHIAQAIERHLAHSHRFKLATAAQFAAHLIAHLQPAPGVDRVIAAVRSKFDLSRARQTARIPAALDDPHVRILARPPGRLIDRREPYDVDMLAVVRKCKARGVALELNAHPERLDLTDLHCRMAKDEGVLVAIDSDAHSVHDFDHLVHGIGQARRGWLERADVPNARPLDAPMRWLRCREDT